MKSENGLKLTEKLLKAHKKIKPWVRIRWIEGDGGRKHIHPEDFVRVWQTHHSLKEISKITKIPVVILRNRAGRYRAHGVPLMYHWKLRESTKDWWRRRELAGSVK